MTPAVYKDTDFAIYARRRREILERVKSKYVNTKGAIIFFANVEVPSGCQFKQDSSFYYYTGVEEPGAVLLIYLTGETTIFLPNYAQQRAQWLPVSCNITPYYAQLFQVDYIKPLGTLCHGYHLNSYFVSEEYNFLLEEIERLIKDNYTLFTFYSPATQYSLLVRALLYHIQSFIPAFITMLTDISSLVASMRRKKDDYEVQCIYQAIGITIQAHRAAANILASGVNEAEVHAQIEYIMLRDSSRPAFPCIVGSGANSTVLHYNLNNKRMQTNEVVVIDIGAEYKNYAADLTRTYPISGIFTPRQKEMYTLVLEAQGYIADKAAPGYWLSNKECPKKSLNHLATEFLAKHHVASYFLHGIGHFLGLDVHDMGNNNDPLQEGDVITIEPGIYIAAENIGIRIEDNYYITKNNALCLSEALPKKIEDVEKMVTEKDFY